MPLLNWLTALSAKTDTKVKGDEVFVRICPFCGNDRWNLQININKLVWHCWACDRGKGESLKTLLAFYGIKFYGRKMKKGLITDNDFVQSEARNLQKDEKFCLPVKAVKLEGSDTLAAKAIKKYLNQRGIYDYSDIYYDTLDVIIPLYDHGVLVYYVRRRIFGKLYQNPKLSKTNFLAEMGDSVDAVICEGVFDALSIKQLGYTAIPILGKFMTDRQIRSLQRRNYRKVIVCLDADAHEAAIDLFARLQYHRVNAYLALLEEGDPNSVPPEVLKEVLESAIYTLPLSKRIELMEKRNGQSEKSKKDFKGKTWFDKANSNYTSQNEV